MAPAMLRQDSFAYDLMSVWLTSGTKFNTPVHNISIHASDVYWYIHVASVIDFKRRGTAISTASVPNTRDNIIYLWVVPGFFFFFFF